VSDRELCTAFYLERSGDSERPEELLERAGATSTWTWQPSGDTLIPLGEILYAEWGGLRCEVWIRDLQHLRVLTLVYPQGAFMELFDLDGGTLIERDGARAFIDAFRDACVALSPEAAFVITSPQSDLDAFLAEQEQAVVTLDELALLKAPFGLVYLSESLAADVDPLLGLEQREELPVPGGRAFFAGAGDQRWWG
jgi:hypothetical protein